MGLHAHLTVIYHTHATDRTGWCNLTFIDVDVRDINLTALLSSSNKYIIEFQHTTRLHTHEPQFQVI